MDEIHVIVADGSFNVAVRETPLAGGNVPPVILDGGLMTVPAWFDDSLRLSGPDAVLESGRLYELIAMSAARTLVITHPNEGLLAASRRLAPITSGRTIVLTGHVTPLPAGAGDAAFNLGGAMVAAQLLPAGVYVAIGGQVHDHRYVARSADCRRYERIGGS
jgi:L-asparaginase